MLTDQQARQRALDSNTSFIVQAPAGSGKTELLTQRFLGLLGKVNQAPEEIKALTFTRKAAAEMRSRIINALKRGQNDTPPEKAHGKITWQLAREALARDKELNWQIIDNPNRLCIQTIDALCASIASQAPILSQLGANPGIAEDARYLYQEAADAFMLSLDNNVLWQTALADLLFHLDNNTTWLNALFVSMLAKRDQWLPQILQQQDVQQLRINLENSLSMISQEALQACVNYFPRQLAQDFIAILQASDEYRDVPFNLRQLPSANIEQIQFWQQIASLLLTKTFTWRKTINKNHGFPPAAKPIKAQMQAIIDQLSDNEELRTALKKYSAMPATSVCRNTVAYG